MLCYVMLCYVTLRYVTLCYVMLFYVMLCYVMLCYAMLCYVMLCHVDTLMCACPCDGVRVLVMVSAYACDRKFKPAHTHKNT